MVDIRIRIDRINSGVFGAFNASMNRFLREEFPEKACLFSDDQIQESIGVGLQRCQNLSITDENSVAKYIYLMWLFGPDFESRAGFGWLAGLLQDRRRPASHRLQIAMQGVKRMLAQ